MSIPVSPLPGMPGYCWRTVSWAHGNNTRNSIRNSSHSKRLRHMNRSRLLCLCNYQKGEKSMPRRRQEPTPATTELLDRETTVAEVMPEQEVTQENTPPVESPHPVQSEAIHEQEITSEQSAVESTCPLPLKFSRKNPCPHCGAGGRTAATPSPDYESDHQSR